MSFDEYVKKFKSHNHNKPIKKGSGNYWTLFALWQGNMIDDYFNRPTDNLGREIRNIKSRVSDLKNKFGVNIESRNVENERYVEYFLKK